MDRVWELTQNPQQHSRWDVRFSAITPTEVIKGEQLFEYSRTVGFIHTVRGTGVSVGERESVSGSRTSALKFFTKDVFSPIRRGSGYWRYVPEGRGVRFITGYDYSPGWGELPDKFVRPLLGWATAYSFDRLRLWAEDKSEPERWPMASALAFWNPLRPLARQCLRQPTKAAASTSTSNYLDDAPSTLSTLAEPRVQYSGKSGVQ